MIAARARPLVVITRAEEPNGPLARALEARGLACWTVPTIAIAPTDQPAALDRALEQLRDCDWIVFTSRHAVKAIVDRPAWHTARAQGGRQPRIAALGRATAERLMASGLPVDLMPDVFGAGPLVDALQRTGGDLAGCRVLWPRADIALPLLRERLEQAGAIVDAPVAYRTIPAADAGRIRALEEALSSGRVAAIAFLSPSSALGLARALGTQELRAVAAACTIASLGPTTSAALCELGAPPHVEAVEHSAEGLASALHDHLQAMIGGRT